MFSFPSQNYGPGRIDIAGRLFAQFYKNLPTSVYNLSHLKSWSGKELLESWEEPRGHLEFLIASTIYLI